MPRLIGRSARVVDSDGFIIDEFAGNVATSEDRISIALVQVQQPTAEPWLTLHYDEWICVLKGRMQLHSASGVLEVTAGDTVFIDKGERFKPVFPDGGTEYVPICLPAFKPERCIRENETGKDEAVATRLEGLHGSSSKPPPPPPPTAADERDPEVLFHMCEKTLWDAAVAAGTAYFPPTFDADGFTHATAVPARLIETANHFYQETPGDWICLRMTRTALKHAGIVVVDEEALPVGDRKVGDTWTTWICPHIRGGIPHKGVVDATFPMTRDGPTYLDIDGLTTHPQGTMCDFPLGTTSHY